MEYTITQLQMFILKVVNIISRDQISLPGFMGVIERGR